MSRLTTLFSTTIILWIGIQPAMAKGIPSPIEHLLTETPVVLEHSSQPLADEALDFLEERNPSSARVWVFFTDKGIFNQKEFNQKATNVSLSEKVMRRRSKTGTDKVLFLDIPVRSEYVEGITDAGGDIRRISKWINAVSCDISYEDLNDIANLPYVARIIPVAASRRVEPTIESMRLDPGNNKALAPDVLDYGSSATQLLMINVPTVHELGFDGSGVTLAIFDTGFRKSHEAFAMAYFQNRVHGEYDFVFEDDDVANEAEDWSSQWNHGTYIWSVSGGALSGEIYGPAYRSNFLLAKTEDVRSETTAEEDNWVAAVEWADSLGADVITSSLSYPDFYLFEDLDGETAVITIAANLATALGIVVCNSAGNYGPNLETIAAPADAFEILTVGAVNSSEELASFSSRGPTADGRIKPEVSAMGVATYSASASSDNSYTTVSGTSLSTPLVAGAACLLIQARPFFSPQAVRLALMETADNAATPNNNDGWGVIDLAAALDWGCNFYTDITFGHVPVTVQFNDSSEFAATSWDWTFGNGDVSTDQNPSYEYTQPGIYDVSLEINTASYGTFSRNKVAHLVLLADTLTFTSDSAYAGESLVISVTATNSQTLDKMLIPFTFEENPAVVLDSVRRGSRTASFEGMTTKLYNPASRQFVYELQANLGGGTPALAPGSGEVMKLYFTIDEWALGAQSNSVDSLEIGAFKLEMYSPDITYQPIINSGTVSTKYVLRGDIDSSGSWDISDLTTLVDYVFGLGEEPLTKQSADVDADLSITIADVTYFVEYLFAGGPPPSA